MKTNESLALLISQATAPVKRFITMKEALQRAAELGMKIDIITMIRIGQEQGFAFQPRARNPEMKRGGKWFIEKEPFEQFLRRPNGGTRCS